MRVSVTLGADADGVLTALAVDVLSDTGAYGNHAAGVLFHGCHESVALYRCANKRVDAEAVYTNNVPSGAFRGYGLGQVIFAIESALDELARELGDLPGRAAPAQRRRPGDEFVVNGAARRPTWSSAATASTSASTWSSRRWRPATTPRLRPASGWAVGEGMAASMIATIPPRGHHAEATVDARPPTAA